MEDAKLMAEMFRRMWLDNGVREEDLVEDASERVRRFLDRGRRDLGLRLFFATENTTDVGGAVCQRFDGLYPDILSPRIRRYGYIWGIYVAPEARRRGVGKALSKRCVAALRDAGCTRALLHAAPMGVNVYRGLGFDNTNEMSVDLLDE